MKKLISVLLCLAMLMSLVACDNKKTPAPDNAQSGDASQEAGEPTGGEEQSGSETEASAIDFDEDPYTLNVCYAVLGEAQPDLAMIEEKLNEITLKEINCKVKLEAVSLFSLANIYALKASSQEKMDLMILFPGSSYLAEFANNNMLMPIEDYVDQWGSDIKEVLGDMISAGEYDGHTYAIAQNRNLRKNENGFNISKQYCDKYNIDPNSIKTLEDLEAVFDMMKEKEPNVISVMPETTGGGIAGTLADYYDSLGTRGVALEEQADGKLKVIPITQQKSVIAACAKVREWYEKGYISKDVLTDQDGGAAGLQTGKCLASAANSLQPASGDRWSYAVRIHDERPLLSTSDDQLILWGVASSCARPDKAIQFLNLCYASADIANLMMNGVEDVHYKVLENGAIDNSMNENYQNYWPMFGDFFKQYIRQGDIDLSDATTPEEYTEILLSWKVELSPAYGFNFNPANVKTEVAGVTAVSDEYMLPIFNGTVDPVTEIPKWEEKMMAAGLQTVIDEMQSQMDAWVAAK
ncbi:MAG TPA: ABC transporter substrate-binding protein [Clostridiales bacterium]|nr:ABC transporter substrate-binding protein [Clostridiales bacterium]